ncbi:hypothetical protein [Slackia piriformis]|uniref:hypothetical protein n=1 Tax=Slackia piriformis TaxID=626934 RepID=UPI0026DD7734|nr:hypothetical protein [Slackia piriformis]MDO5023759.1 hypothetical protein [Slackia piriformis]
MKKASVIVGSKKRSAWAKETAEFKASLGGMDDIFAREEQRNARRSQEKEAALRKKACESKNRYASRYEALDAIASCAEHGTTGLQCYRCPHCNGWHLTSHPHEEH